MTGRPPIAPRVLELEELSHQHAQIIEALQDHTRDLEKQVNILLNILHGMDDRIKDLESYKPRKQSKAYEPLFDHWPANGR